MTLREEYESGSTIACLSVRHKKSERQILRELHRAGTVMRPNHPNPVAARIVELGKLDWAPKDIAAELDCHRSHVSRVLVAAGIRQRGKRVPRIVELGSNGWGPLRISREVHCSPDYASVVLIRAGIRTRRKYVKSIVRPEVSDSRLVP